MQGKGLQFDHLHVSEELLLSKGECVKAADPMFYPFTSFLEDPAQSSQPISAHLVGT